MHDQNTVVTLTKTELLLYCMFISSGLVDVYSHSELQLVISVTLLSLMLTHLFDQTFSKKV